MEEGEGDEDEEVKEAEEGEAGTEEEEEEEEEEEVEEVGWEEGGPDLHPLELCPSFPQVLHVTFLLFLDGWRGRFVHCQQEKWQETSNKPQTQKRNKAK